ncbi:MAG: hypothetical protein HC880_16050 [Bacteroidia bacterium]|nr:hypothetical protein [Bacteroidia bacterium]
MEGLEISRRMAHFSFRPPVLGPAGGQEVKTLPKNLLAQGVPDERPS